MHYVAIVEGEEHPLTVHESRPGHYVVSLAERQLAVDAVSVGSTADGGDASLSLLIDGTAHHVELERRDGQLLSRLRDSTLAVEVLGLREVRLRQARLEGAGSSGPARLAAPMPGKVVRVWVRRGEQVVAGQGLLVVEAMKMENELRAPRDGTVQALDVVEGQVVESGSILCVVD